MRLPTVNCIILAYIAVTIATVPEQEELRPKRDLQFWKNLIASKLGIGNDKSQPSLENEEIKILRIPGFDNVLVRAVPKITVIQTTAPAPETVVMDPTVAALQSYLGTHTPDQTLVALQGVKNLLESGVLAAREVVEVPSEKQQVFFLPPTVQERVVWPEPGPNYSYAMVAPAPRVPMYPVFPAPMPQPVPVWPQPMPEWPQPVPVMKPMIPMMPEPLPAPVPALRPVRPIMPPPLPIRPQIVVPQIKPLPMPPVVQVPVVPTKYFYKKNMNTDGTMTSYRSYSSRDVIVTRTNEPLPPPPSYIIDRFQKIIYGMPLGVSLVPERGSLPRFPKVVAEKSTAPIVFEPPSPYFFRPEPIITESAAVNVKVKPNHQHQPHKHLYQGSISTFEGMKVVKPPMGVSLVSERAGLPPNPTIVAAKPAVPIVFGPPPSYFFGPEPAAVNVKVKPNHQHQPHKHLYQDSISTFEGMKVVKPPMGVSLVPESAGLPPIPTVVAANPAVPIVFGPPPPYFFGPEPIITEPAAVNIKVKPNHQHQPHKHLYQGSISTFEGTKVVKPPFTSMIQEQNVVPAHVPVPMETEFVPPSPLILEELKTGGRGFPYKHFHGDGSVTTNTGSAAVNEPSISVTTGDVSKIPAPPKYIMDRIENVADKAHSTKSMWGYSFKLSDGVGDYKTIDNDKIYYSRLSPGAPKSGLGAMPRPLSSNSDDDQRNPNKNRYIVDGEPSPDAISNRNGIQGGDEVETDEYGNPFLSTKIDEKNYSNELSPSGKYVEKEKSAGPDITPVKVIPKLPMPIVGDSVVNELPDVAEGNVKISGYAGFDETNEGVTFSVHETEKKKEENGGTGSYSYTQVNEDGSVTKHLGYDNGKLSEVTIDKKNQKIPAHPSAVFDVVQPLPNIPVAVDVVEKQPPALIDVFQPIPEAPVAVNVVEKQPAAFIDVFQPIPKAPVAVNVVEKHPPAFIDVFQPIPKTPVAVNVVEKHPSAIVDVFQPIPKAPVAVDVVEKHPPAFIDVIQPIPKAPVAVNVVEKHPSAIVNVFQPISKAPVAVDVVERHPPAFIDVIKPIPKAPVAVNVVEKQPPPFIDVFQPISKAPVAVNVVKKHPSAIVDVFQPIAKAPVAVDVVEKHPPGFIDVIQPIPKAPVAVNVVEKHPSAIVDVFQPIPKAPVAVDVVEKHPPAFIDVIQPIPKAPVAVNLVEKHPSAIVDVFKPIPKAPVAVDVVERHPPAFIDVIKPIPKAPVAVNVVEKQPPPFIDVIQPKPKAPVAVNVVEKHPSAIIDVFQPIQNVPVGAKVVEKRPTIVDVIQPIPAVPAAQKHPPGADMFAKPVVSSYIYKQISHTNPKPFTVVQVEDRPRDIVVTKGDVHVKVNKHEHTRPDVIDVVQRLPNIPVTVDVVEKQPPAFIDVIQPIQKAPVAVNVVEKHPSAIVDVFQPIQNVPDGSKVVKKRPTIVDVIQPIPAVPAAQKRPSGAVMVATPVVSNYVYKQISHTNPKPFTVVQVEDRPRDIVVPKGDVHVKVNKHEHTRPDGTKYPCTEVHVNPDVPAAVMPMPGIPIAPVPAIPSAHVVATVPSGFMYVPPKTAEGGPPPRRHKKKKQPCSEGRKCTTTTAAPKTTTEEDLSLNFNPIVVEPEDTKYSYTQTNSDGSSMSVEGNKDTVLVNVNNAVNESSRGDIPSALA